MIPMGARRMIGFAPGLLVLMACAAAPKHASTTPAAGTSATPAAAGPAKDVEAVFLVTLADPAGGRRARATPARSSRRGSRPAGEGRRHRTGRRSA